MARFYSERKRLEEIAKKEAVGENLWSIHSPDALRQKVVKLAEYINGEMNEHRHWSQQQDVFEFAQGLLTSDLGVEHLWNSGSNERQDMIGYIKNVDHDLFPNSLEALYLAIAGIDNISRSKPLEKIFEKRTNELLESYRVSYSLEDGEIVPFSSKEVHVKVVAPALRLISKRGWENVEIPYKKALDELANNKPDNAITDATTALQEALRKMGCKGRDFKSLSKSARTTILDGFDGKYLDAIDKLIEWASASRVNRGDSHKTVNPSKEDAWLVIHLVGVLILHLSSKVE